MTDSKKVKSPKPKGAWVETSPDGQLLFCYKTKSHGQRVDEKLTIEQINNFLQENIALKF